MIPWKYQETEKVAGLSTWLLHAGKDGLQIEQRLQEPALGPDVIEDRAKGNRARLLAASRVYKLTPCCDTGHAARSGGFLSIRVFV